MESTPRPSGLGVARRRRGEDAIRVLLFLAAAISVLTTVGILVALLTETFKFFGDVGIGNLFSDKTWSPLFNPPEYGIRQLLIGTFLVTGIAILVAIPLGLGSAIYLSEYASPRARRDHQADPRDPGRHPDDRPRLLRPDLARPDLPPRPARAGRRCLQATARFSMSATGIVPSSPRSQGSRASRKASSTVICCPSGQTMNTSH